MIHLYFGEGKGKTTAALGLSVRALGSSVPVVFVQFLKSRHAGEVDSLEKLGAVVLRGKGCGKFVSAMDEDERRKTRRISDANLSRALSIVSECGAPALLVLDEVCAAWNSSLVDRGAVESLVMSPPPLLELVLTGRNPPAVFLERADYITEMVKVRHPFDSGVAARRGVEF